MHTMFFDIETLPAPVELEDLVREQYERVPDRPGTYDEFFRRTALNGNYGRLLCIAYAINEEPTQLIQGDEREQLKTFWEVAKTVDRFVGHNILDFDLPFLMKRSIIHQLKPSRQLSFARYRSDPIYDTQKEWDNWSHIPATGLDALAKIFGYQTSKQGIDGSQVYDFWLAGKLTEIYAYCMRDVHVNRQVYRRMNYLADLPLPMPTLPVASHTPEPATSKNESPSAQSTLFGSEQE